MILKEIILNFWLQGSNILFICSCMYACSSVMAWDTNIYIIGIVYVIIYVDILYVDSHLTFWGQ